MTNSQVNLCPLSSPACRRQGLALFLSVPVTAQQFSADTADQGPVDLLATIQDNRSTGSDEIPMTRQTPARQAQPVRSHRLMMVKSVTELPVLEVPATSEPTQPATIAETAADASTTAEGDSSGTAASGTAAAPASQGVTLDITQEGTGDTGAASRQQPDRSGASLQKSSAPVFGIANIRLRQTPA